MSIQPKKCAHPPCSCRASGDSDSCSPYCESARDRAEINCCLSEVALSFVFFQSHKQDSESRQRSWLYTSVRLFQTAIQNPNFGCPVGRAGRHVFPEFIGPAGPAAYLGCVHPIREGLFPWPRESSYCRPRVSSVFVAGS
jgi:hypothetical protein